MIALPSVLEAKQDALQFIDIIEKHLWGDFGKYSRLYHVSTENVKEYTEAMDCSFETTLTVGGSADQGIAANSKGAKKVYFFDINRSDIYFVAFKKIAFETLRRKDFLDFLIAEDTGIIMEYRLYEKIRGVIPNSLRVFWDTLYSYFNYNTYHMSELLFRSPKENAAASKIVNGYYKNNKIYYETQDKVKDSEWFFIESDFYDLDKKLPENVSYDAIILSNIYEYLNFGIEVSVEEAKKYISFIKKVLLPRLKEKGCMLASYIYRYDKQLDEFIKRKLEEDPNGWVSSNSTIADLTLEDMKKIEVGYTGQNVSYHYLLNELKKEFPLEMVETKAAGYGLSPANNDVAILIKK